jgi:hypothetical protein
MYAILGFALIKVYELFQLPFKMIGTFKQEEELLFAIKYIRLKTFIVRQSLQRIH